MNFNWKKNIKKREDNIHIPSLNTVLKQNKRNPGILKSDECSKEIGTSVETEDDKSTSNNENNVSLYTEQHFKAIEKENKMFQSSKMKNNTNNVQKSKAGIHKKEILSDITNGVFLKKITESSIKPANRTVELNVQNKLESFFCNLSTKNTTTVESEANSDFPINSLITTHCNNDIYRLNFKKRTIPNGIQCINSNEKDKIKYCTEYSEEIYAYLYEIQEMFRPNSNYITLQKDLTNQMRVTLISWLSEVIMEYNLTSQTLHLSTNYIDRYLSKKLISRENFQLLGVTSLLIAAKYEEVSLPNINDLVYISDNTYTKKQVVEMEGLILQTLSFQLGFPSSKVLAFRLLRLEPFTSKKFKYFVFFLLDLSLLNYSMIKYLPSQISTAAIVIASYTLNNIAWTVDLQFYSKLKFDDIIDCAIDMCNFHQSICCQEESQAIWNKFSSVEKYQVTSIPIRIPPTTL